MNIDEVMESFGLGLSRDGSVLLMDHSACWETAFAFESKRVREALPSLSLVVHHMGSTSIHTICAKPILDLLVETSTLEAFDGAKSEFEKLGYDYKGEYGIPGRRYCVL